MPELPEVQTVVDTLAPALVGRTIRRIVHLRHDIVCPADADLVRRLRFRTISAVARRGKRIVLSLDDGDRWFVHLGMTGRLTMHAAADALRPHTHLIADCGEGRQLRFVDPRRFGRIAWLGRDEADAIGVEPLTMRPAVLMRLLHRRKRAIKTALLDQKLIAGIGNIYADEALFAAGIHPLTWAGALGADDVRRLNRSIKTVLRRAIRHRGSSLRDYVDANGMPGDFQSLHRVYDRAGQGCVTCGTAIQRIIVGQRSTHFCPRCQRRSIG